jgi:hypothetical protein
MSKQDQKRPYPSTALVLLALRTGAISVNEARRVMGLLPLPASEQKYHRPRG